MDRACQVIVTRPSPFGEELCEVLDNYHFKATHCPLITFQANTDTDYTTRIKQLNQCTSWIFVSRQAVNFCLEDLSANQLSTLQELSKQKSIIAVGPSTADSLASFGFHAMTPDTPDSEGMISLLKKHQLHDQPACLIRGNQGRELLQQFFADDQLTIMPVYKRVPTSHTFPSLMENTAVVVTSGQLLELAERLLHKQSSARQPAIIAGSERIADKARQLGYTNCYTANSAANSDLIKACILWRNDVT
ncbi:uroporphyrinogen-III synthase [Kangiella sediminilitoris]|uniref:Uroporphyrinogen-III synthase n=1 Tax=Kangiella sediminilitoris TaxID=1144748 RepID=A0A1B3B7R9_9GAMM|nr:uroporphyrinogen-III synthase [Kangiella sediminilitoris]AOE48833.1 Uroporphyrinogen III synthase HEM4 [Kangiella sediminilitoris]